MTVMRVYDPIKQAYVGISGGASELQVTDGEVATVTNLSGYITPTKDIRYLIVDNSSSSSPYFYLNLGDIFSGVKDGTATVLTLILTVGNTVPVIYLTGNFRVERGSMPNVVINTTHLINLLIRRVSAEEGYVTIVDGGVL